MEEVSRELWPFYAAMCSALLIVTYVPAFSLWLPHLLTIAREDRPARARFQSVSALAPWESRSGPGRRPAALRLVDVDPMPTSAARRTAAGSRRARGASCRCRCDARAGGRAPRPATSAWPEGRAARARGRRQCAAAGRRGVELRVLEARQVRTARRRPVQAPQARRVPSGCDRRRLTAQTMKLPACAAFGFSATAQTWNSTFSPTAFRFFCHRARR